ncbi:MAG: amidohydrolase [Actinobacteria bacterium]|nr:amidohydrolase [Actinomycetota bacterium]
MSPENLIDVHHHFLPREYLSTLGKMGITEFAGRPFPAWTPEDSLTLMDRHGIRAAVASLSCPGVYFGDLGLARDLARMCNEYAAELSGEKGRRWGAFATVPLPDVDAALAELGYALDTLKLDGVALPASVGDRYLGDPAFDGLFDELNRRKAAVFVHPGVPPGSDVPRLDLPHFLVEFVFDTTRAVANLLFSGTLQRCPDIRFILAHAGGTVPFLLFRLSLGQFLPGLQEKVPEGVASYLGRLYYDTALSASPTALRSLQELVDCSHIVFGSDYPFAPEAAAAITIKGLEDYGGFDEQEIGAIKSGNALSLFPCLRET